MSIEKRRKPNQRTSTGAAEIAEFSLVFYVLFMILLLPLINFTSILIAGTTQYLATNDVAAKAATQPTYASALSQMVSEAFDFQSNSLARFVHLQPQGGYIGCGADLYVLSTDIGQGVVSSSSADQPLGGTINTTKSLYEFSVKSTYTVAPQQFRNLCSK